MLPKDRPHIERIFWVSITSVLVIALVLQTTRKSADALSYSSGNYAFSVFQSVYEIIRDDYVEVFDPMFLATNAINGMLAGLDDKFTDFMTRNEFTDMMSSINGEYEGFGVTIEVRRQKYLTIIDIFKDSPAQRAGLQIGDRILKIDDKDCIGVTLDRAVEYLTGPSGGSSVFIVKRIGVDEPFAVTLRRGHVNIDSAIGAMAATNIGYIRVNEFSELMTGQFESQLNALKSRGAAALIVDMRGNPGGSLTAAVSLSDLFLTNGKIVYTRGRSQQISDVYAAHSGEIAPGMPLIVLVDEKSASAAEIFAGAMQDRNRGLIIGTKTYGKGSVQTLRQISQDFYLRVTTQYYYTPAGQRIHKIGLMPNIIVSNFKPSDADSEAIEEIRDTSLVADFADRHPINYSDAEFAALKNRAKQDGFIISDTALSNEIFEMQWRTRLRPVLPIAALDAQFTYALRTLQTNRSIVPTAEKPDAR